MKNVVSKFLIRNVIEVAVLFVIIFYFCSFKAILIQSIFPLVFVLLIFLFDFYKLYNFYKKNDLNGLLKFQSKFLFYTFAWYFTPIFLSIYLIIKNVNGLRKEYLLVTALIYGALYLYNLSGSRKLKKSALDYNLK